MSKNFAAFENMSLAELKEFQRDIAGAVSKALAADRQKLRDKYLAQVTEDGITVSELIHILSPTLAKEKKTRKKAVIGYHHKDDPTVKWSGWGRRPKWVSDYGLIDYQD